MTPRLPPNPSACLGTVELAEERTELARRWAAPGRGEWWRRLDRVAAAGPVSAGSPTRGPRVGQRFASSAANIFSAATALARPRRVFEIGSGCSSSKGMELDLGNALGRLLQRALDDRDEPARVERLGDGVDGARLLHELAADLVALGAHQHDRQMSDASSSARSSRQNW